MTGFNLKDLMGLFELVGDKITEEEKKILIKGSLKQYDDIGEQLSARYPHFKKEMEDMTSDYILEVMNIKDETEQIKSILIFLKKSVLRTLENDVIEGYNELFEGYEEFVRVLVKVVDIILEMEF